MWALRAYRRIRIFQSARNGSLEETLLRGFLIQTSRLLIAGGRRDAGWILERITGRDFAVSRGKAFWGFCFHCLCGGC